VEKTLFQGVIGMALGPINANSQATLTAQRFAGVNSSKLGSNLNKLASGLRINKASDDAAGLAIVKQLEADLRSLGQAQRNISDGASLTRVAEGGLSEISSLLARGRELSVQAANGTLTDEQRSTLNQEITSIKEEIDRITNVTEFNGQQLLSGDFAPGSATPHNVQAGAQATPSDQISLNQIEATSTAALGVDTVDISTQQGARDALDAFDSAIAQVNSNRAGIGALQNRLDAAASNLAVSRENITAAVSQIQDLDYAAETAETSRNQILVQAAVRTLTQSLQSNAGVIGSLLNVRG